MVYPPLSPVTIITQPEGWYFTDPQRVEGWVECVVCWFQSGCQYTKHHQFHRDGSARLWRGLFHCVLCGDVRRGPRWAAATSTALRLSLTGHRLARRAVRPRRWPWDLPAEFRHSGLPRLISVQSGFPGDYDPGISSEWLRRLFLLWWSWFFPTVFHRSVPSFRIHLVTCRRIVCKRPLCCSRWDCSGFLRVFSFTFAFTTVLLDVDSWHHYAGARWVVCLTVADHPRSTLLSIILLLLCDIVCLEWRF